MSMQKFGSFLCTGDFMTQIGTLAWLDQTNGKVRVRDRLMLIAQGVISKARTSVELKSKYKIRNIEVSKIMPPDSLIAKEALLICQEASPEYLFNHCLRSYFWTRLLNVSTAKFDDEALFVAIMLHDLGLCEGYRLKNTTQQCFTSVGAHHAFLLANKYSWHEKRCETTAQAIALHLNVIIDHKHGMEARMLRQGSGADVAALGLHILERDQINSVVDLFPRKDFKRNIIHDLDIETNSRPCCRIAFLQNNLGFKDLIQNSFFHE